MGKEMNRTAQRDEIMEKVRQFLATEYTTDCKYVAGGEIMLPAVDDEGEEFYFTFKAAIPRGKRKDGGYIPYDGYAAAEAYEIDQQIKAEEKAAKEAEKARKAAEKERLKAAKKTVKKLNKEGLDKMVHEDE